MKALVTFALGDYQQLAEIARPGLEAYADQHGYRLYTEAPAYRTRPASWLKIPMLLAALEAHEEVLWLDADVVVADGSCDIADEVPDWALHALVRHHTPDGEVPNCGVWFLRAAMGDVLEQLWRAVEYLTHPWWEQAALLDLLGYEHRRRPVTLVCPTPLYKRTCWLDLSWNSHEERDRHASPRFAHATAGPLDWRAQVMRDYTARTLAPI